MKMIRSIAGEVGEPAARGHYMIAAALDIMESTFGDRETHERVTGRKNTYYVGHDQLDLIFYLLYEAATATKQVRNRLDRVD